MAGFNINFNALNQPNFLGNAVTSYRAGGVIRDDRDRRAALANYGNDPEGAVNALAALGRFEDANAAMTVRDNAKKMRGRAAAEPYLKDGDFQGASEAAAKGGDVAYGEQVAQYTARDLDLNQKKARIGAQVLWAASEAGSPEAAAAIVSRNRDRLVSMGFPAEEIDSYDFSNPQQMKADAGVFLDLDKQIGVIRTEKFGDRVVTTRTSPYGVNTLGSQEIPETREERRAREKMEREKFENDRRFGLDREKFNYERTQEETQGPPTDRVVGRLINAQANGRKLSPDQQAVVDRWYEGRGRQGAGTGDDYGYGDGGGASNSPASGINAMPHTGGPPPRGANPRPQSSIATGQPTPKTPPGQPGQPPPGGSLPPRAVAQLKEGQTTTFANGQTWTLRGGRPARVQ